MRQVVFTDVLIVDRLDVDGQSFAPIGFPVTKFSDDISCQLYVSINLKEDVTFHLKIREATGKFKNQPRPLLRPSSVNFLIFKTVYLTRISIGCDLRKSPCARQMRGAKNPHP